MKKGGGSTAPNRHGHPGRDVIERLDDSTFPATAHQMQWAFRENNQRVWHVEPAYEESIYSTVMSGTIVVRATKTSFGIDVSRDGPPPP